VASCAADNATAIVRLRREWGISQPQLARILNVGLRTVKRWEAHQGKPMMRTRDLLGHLIWYADTNRPVAFQERYVREAPRYHKSGPAHCLAENPFDSRVGGDSPSAFVVN
jgi:hypothetical protein